MKYEHEDSSGNRLRIEPSNINDLVRFTVVDSHGMSRSTVHARRTIGEAAAGALEAAGVTPSLTASLDCPEHYEKRALAHLQQARVLRERRDNQTREVTKIAGKLVNIIGAHSDVEVNQETIRALAGWVYETYEKDGKAEGPRQVTALDQEPPRNTHWVTVQRGTMAHDGSGWVVKDKSGEFVGRYGWGHIPGGNFPLTEYTPVEGLVTAEQIMRAWEEPSHDTVLSTADRFILQHINDSWCLRNPAGGIVRTYPEWRNIPGRHFPMKKVNVTAEQKGGRRALSHLDEEPEHDTIWDTADKFKLWHGGASWLLSNEHGEVVGRFDWGQLPATVFPLRETVQTQRVVRHMVELTEEDRGLQWRDSCGLQWAYDRNNHWWHYWSVPDSEHHRSTPTNFPWRQVTVS